MQDFEGRILNNWAVHFQCPVSTINQSGTTLIPDEKYAQEQMINCWHIGKHTFALFDPSFTGLLNDLLAQLPTATSLTGDTIRQELGVNAIASDDIGLIHYLSPFDVPNLPAPNTFHIRELALADRESLSALHSNCTPEEADDGFVEIDHEIVFGCFQDDELVAAASGYRMAGFMDMGVLTHTRFRKLSLGKVVVGALCKWAIDHDIIAQYRCDSQNAGSLGVARALKFQHYFNSESILLTR